jgi:hypothetical protein
VAPGVANSGTIQAKLGRVVVAGAQTYAVDFYGDGLISFDVGPQVTTVPVGADGKPLRSLVSNTGRINAPGGTVLLTADAVSGIVHNVVDVPGRINARTQGNTPGSVTIDAGAGGNANLSGSINVSGYRPGQVGGSATVTGGSVTLASTARIRARGNAGGGTVRIGGGPHGQDPSVRNAQTTTVAAGALIDASATGNGNGGLVTVWSDGTTAFNGSILSQGGPAGGNGGWVETSGHNQLMVGPAASVNASAPKGAAGLWLLDPDSDITITNSTSSPPSSSCSGSICVPLTDNSIVPVATINNALNNGTSVTVYTYNPNGTQHGNIFVDGEIQLLPPSPPPSSPPSSPPPSPTALLAAVSNTFTKSAPADVSLTLDAGAGYTALTNGAGGTGTGSITINAPITDTGSGQTLSLTLNAGGSVMFDNTVNIHGGLTVTAGINALGAITQTSPLTVGGASSFTNQSSGGTIILTEAGNALAGAVSLNTSGAGANASLTNDSATGTVLGDSTVGGNLTVNAVGGLTQSGPLTVGGTSSFTASSFSSASPPTVVPGVITLTNMANDLIGAVSLNTTGAGGNANLTNTAATGTTLDTSVVSGNLTVTQALAGATLTLNGNVTASGQTVTLTSAGPINQTTGQISAATLTGSSVGGASLTAPGTGGNLVPAFGPFSNMASGPLSFTDDVNFSTVGTVSSAGNLTLVAANTGGFIFVNGGSTVSADGQSVTLQADNLTLTGTVSAGTTGTVTIEPESSGRAIDIGTGSGALVLSAQGPGNTLGQITANTLAIGNTSAGHLTVNQTVQPPNVTNLQLVSGTGGSTLADSIKIAGTLTLTSAGTVDQTTGSITAASLSGDSGGDASFSQPGNNIGTLAGFDTTSNGNNGNFTLVDAQPNNLNITNLIHSGTGTVSLTTTQSGIIEQPGGVIDPGSLVINSVGPVQMGNANAVDTLAASVTGAGNSFLFRNDSNALTIGTVTVDSVSVANVPSGSVSGVTTNNGSIILETTTSGNLVLNQTVNANNGLTTLGSGAGSVGLASAGTITQSIAGGNDGVIVASGLEVLSAERVSLGAFVGGPTDQSAPNQVARLAGEVLNRGESFVFRNDAANLTIGTVDVVDSFGARLVNPATGVPITGSLSGVVTNNANLGLRVTSSGDLLLMQNVSAGTAGVGLEAAGQIQQSGGVVTGSTLEVTAAGAVSLPDANMAPLVAGQVTGTGNSQLFRDDGTGLTIGAPPTLVETGTGAPPASQMLSVAGLAGVTTTGGNILLETTTAGDVTVSQNVAANGGSVALVAAGVAQETNSAVVSASGLILDAGAAVIFADPNQVATLAGSSGGAFRFVDGRALQIGTVGPIGNIAAQSGVATMAGDVGIQTTGGDLTLVGNVTAGGGSNNAALSAMAGNAEETGGTVTASGLIVDASGNVAFGITENGNSASYGLPNSVQTLTGTAGGVFGFLNGPALTVGTVPSVANVASQSGVTSSPTANGDILIQTNAVGQPLTLAGNITGGGRAIFDTAGGFMQTATVTITDPSLAVDTTGAGVSQLLGIITAPNVSADVVAGLPPAGVTSNPMIFGNLQAPNSTVVLFVDHGAVSGTMAVGQLGLSGTGGSANLFGSIAGVTGQAAAPIGVRDPGPDPAYLFNNCIIALPTCTVISPVSPPAVVTSILPPSVGFLITPTALPTEDVAVIALPHLTATLNIVTPQPVAGGDRANPEAPLTNIFDEERLCTEIAQSASARERCQEILAR